MIYSKASSCNFHLHTSLFSLGVKLCNKWLTLWRWILFVTSTYYAVHEETNVSEFLENLQYYMHSDACNKFKCWIT